MSQPIDFEFTTAGPGLYSLSAATPKAVDRMGDGSVFFDGSQYAQQAATGLMGEGFAVSLDGFELVFGEYGELLLKGAQ